MQTNDFFLIVNPVSGRGRSYQLIEEVKKSFEAKNIRLHVAWSAAPGDIFYWAQQALEEGYRQLLVMGGDGSVHEMVNAICQHPLSKTAQITLGVIPAGTGNDWVKGYFANNQLEHFMESFSKRQIQVQDVCRLRLSAESAHCERFFVNVAGAGFSGQVVETVARWGHLPLGTFTYLVALVYCLFKYKEVKVSMSIDGVHQVCDLLNLSVGKGHFFGGGIHILPHASASSGTLAISLVSKVSRWEVASKVGKLFKGTYGDSRKVQLVSGKKVEIQAENLLPFEAEGEFLGFFNQAFYEIDAMKIRVFSDKITDL